MLTLYSGYAWLMIEREAGMISNNVDSTGAGFIILSQILLLVSKIQVTQLLCRIKFRELFIHIAEASYESMPLDLRHVEALLH